MSKKTNDSKGKANGVPVGGGRKSVAPPAKAKGKTPSTGEIAARKLPKSAALGAVEATAVPGSSPKRKLGLRGAAPWAARHAAKHAAEARARAAEPPPPGSARATIRVPNGAEEIKAKIAELHNCLVQIRAARKNLAKGFFDVGLILREVQVRRLYEAKGYGSFEAFLEREIDLGKTTSLKLARVSEVFVRQSALEFGMDRVLQAMQALETSDGASSGTMKAGVPTPAPSQPVARLPLPLKPPIGRVG